MLEELAERDYVGEWPWSRMCEPPQHPKLLLGGSSVEGKIDLVLALPVWAARSWEESRSLKGPMASRLLNGLNGGPVGKPRINMVS